MQTRRGIISLTLVLAGCAAPSQERDVRAFSELLNGWWDEGQRKPCGISAQVLEADGTKVDENVATLAPGVHDLKISCSLYVGGNFMPQTPAAVKAELAAGRVYALRPRPRAVSCAPYLEDVTDSTGKRAP